MNFRAVIFDLFGTIVDGFLASTAGLSHGEFPAALGVPSENFMKHWREITDRRTMGEFQTVEQSIAHVCRLLGAPITPEQMKNAVAARLQLTRRALKPRPDAVPTLTRLRQHDFRIGLLSNCSIEIPIVWSETTLAGLFDATVFSSRERIKKPDPQIYHLACQRLGVEPKDCLYVADGENYELTAAAKVGMFPVLIQTPSQETRGEVLREAREWQGNAISTIPEVLTLVGVESID